MGHPCKWGKPCKWSETYEDRLWLRFLGRGARSRYILLGDSLSPAQPSGAGTGRKFIPLIMRAPDCGKANSHPGYEEAARVKAPTRGGATSRGGAQWILFSFVLFL
jgi:hypothetical protein